MSKKTTFRNLKNWQKFSCEKQGIKEARKIPTFISSGIMVDYWYNALEYQIDDMCIPRELDYDEEVILIEENSDE